MVQVRNPTINLFIFIIHVITILVEKKYILLISIEGLNKNLMLKFLPVINMYYVTFTTVNGFVGRQIISFKNL